VKGENMAEGDKDSKNALQRAFDKLAVNAAMIADDRLFPGIRGDLAQQWEYLTKEEQQALHDFENS